MTDDALRSTERALVAEPADLELRRRHARLLQRAGQAERALSALDLAWRLGADELWDELRAGLEARALRAGGLELRFVPAGPFVQGSDAHDADVAPARLVDLSAFWLSPAQMTYGALEGTSLWQAWMDAHRGQRLYVHDLPRALAAVKVLAGSPAARALPAGRLGLPTEAQWERALRARLLRREGTSPYGVERIGPEWTADKYAADAYARTARRDPVGRSGALRVVRGVHLRPPHDVLYREAAHPDGTFEVPARRARRAAADEAAARTVRHEGGIAFRVCLVADAP